MQYSRNQVGGVYKRPATLRGESDELMAIIGGAVGLLGIFLFMAALAILPWWVL